MARIEEQAPPEQPKVPPSAPPPLRTPITVYKAKRPRKPWTFWRVLRWALLVMLLLAAAAGAAVFHYVYQPLQAVTDISDRPDLQAAQQHLIPPAPDQPKVALVIGYDRRFGDGLVGSRSDTMMLVSLDPRRHTLSLLSIPRDLRAPIPGHGYDKINAAYSIGQSALTVRTVSEYLDVDVNYIITIDFHGFRDVVDKFGGVYLPIDRRYFNQNTGGYSNFSNIDLKPGYQKLQGGQALSYVRFRHTDTDIFRLARQQTFVREFKRRIDGWSAAGNFPGLIDIMRNNVKFVGATGKTPGPTTMLQYAKEIAETPRSNMFQYRIVGDGGSPSNGYVNASDTEIADTVAAFKNPDLTARDTIARRDVGGTPVKKAAAATSKGKKPIAPAKLRIVTFNGSGFEGAAGGAAQGLKTAGWTRAAVGETPAISGTLPVEYQTFSSTVYFTSPRAESAAKKVQAAIGESDLEGTLPVYLKPLKTSQDVIVVVGKQFTAVAQPPKSTAPEKKPPEISPAPTTFETTNGTMVDTVRTFRAKQKALGFRILYPTVVPRGTTYREPDADYAPLRHYRMNDDHGMAMHLTASAPGLDARYTWDMQWLEWTTPPILDEPSIPAHHVKTPSGDRIWKVYLSDGGQIHRIAVYWGKGVVWVTNSLGDNYSNATMIAVARSLKPVPFK